MVSNGYGYTKIRDFLNSNGYRRADGKLFTSHFTDILRNRKYIGEYVYNRSAYRERGVSYNSHSVRKESEVIRIPHGLPQIVDNQTFNKVQAILDERRKTRRNAEAEHRKYLLSGIVKCGECGRAFSGARVLTNHFEYYIYRCGSRGTCPSRAINATYLEEYVLSLFVDCLLKEGNEEKLTELIKIAYTDANDALHERLYKASKECSELAERIKEYETNIAQDRIKQLQGLV
ncbi:MAG: recombinase family protein [Clostridia bacterium]|nr:recombinase family protein [Clostridia bacterium]